MAAYRYCPKHPHHGYDPDYWAGCPLCHPVLEVEDIRDRLLSGIISLEEATYELLQWQVEQLGGDCKSREVVRADGDSSWPGKASRIFSYSPLLAVHVLLQWQVEQLGGDPRSRAVARGSRGMVRLNKGAINRADVGPRERLDEEQT